MIRSLIFLMTSAFFLCCTPEREGATGQIRTDVEILSSDALQGREVGTEGEKLAADYIADRLKKIGAEPRGTEGFFQPFFVKESQNPHEKPELSSDSISGTSGKNVIGFIDNPGEEIVIIGAHYDHLGYGGFSSLHRGDSAIHNGADDNASGIAALLALAELFQQKRTNRDILLIAFSGEEKGLWGSNYFVKNPTIDLKRVNFMINMDMVGRLDSARGMAINGTGTAPNWPAVLDSANTGGLKVTMKESGVGPSDHTSFYLQDIPVLHFFTGQHEDYHKPTDDAGLINYKGIRKIVNHIANVVYHTDPKARLTFQKTKNESASGPRFTVTLGVVPDYLFDGKGMRIDGVTDDKPAQKAGLQKGDVVVQLGDSTVTDMMSYMRALSAFEAGDQTTVVVDREGEKLEAEIQF